MQATQVVTAAGWLSWKSERHLWEPTRRGHNGWAMLFCDSKNRTTLSVITHSIATVKLRLQCHVFVTGQSQLSVAIYERTYSNRTRSTYESWLSQLKSCGSVYATSESYLSKGTSERKHTIGMIREFVQNCGIYYFCSYNTFCHWRDGKQAAQFQWGRGGIKIDF